MKLNSFCMTCLVQMQERQIRNFPDEEKKVLYMRKIMGFLANADENLSAPALLEPLAGLYEEYWGVQNHGMEKVKKQFNDLLLSMEDALEQEIRLSKEPLETALCYARIGNYIDFGALQDVSSEILLSMFAQENKKPLDEKEYAYFQKDLEKAQKLVYLTDNCGEIVLDKIVMKLLKEQYPDLSIEVIVRGAAVSNDAALEDAEYVGLTDLVSVLGNGSRIAGTELSCISKEARQKIQQADVIISKGQGNFETIHGCGLNIYYLFLCKCDWFMRKFQAKHLEGMFVNERRI